MYCPLLIVPLSQDTLLYLVDEHPSEANSHNIPKHITFLPLSQEHLPSLRHIFHESVIVGSSYCDVRWDTRISAIIQGRHRKSVNSDPS